ncbi:MAG: hypothetical protein E6I08_12280 [Chloroflexi bacterium]|nr:MAG: hypothetical protein E6I08_12280 [Chloroflexota bacterium]
MMIAIVSDIHGNWEALKAVLKDLGTVRPDVVVHAGDLAVNGPAHYNRPTAESHEYMSRRR